MTIREMQGELGFHEGIAEGLSRALLLLGDDFAEASDVVRGALAEAQSRVFGLRAGLVRAARESGLEP